MIIAFLSWLLMNFPRRSRFRPSRAKCGRGAGAIVSAGCRKRVTSSPVRFLGERARAPPRRVIDILSHLAILRENLDVPVGHRAAVDSIVLVDPEPGRRLEFKSLLDASLKFFNWKPLNSDHFLITPSPIVRPSSLQLRMIDPRNCFSTKAPRITVPKPRAPIAAGFAPRSSQSTWR